LLLCCNIMAHEEGAVYALVKLLVGTSRGGAPLATPQVPLVCHNLKANKAPDLCDLTTVCILLEASDGLSYLLQTR
jgi:hypothetical protein